MNNGNTNLESLAKSLHSILTPEVYIASPFFDPASMEWVKSKEQMYEGARVPHFSPRSLGISPKDANGNYDEAKIHMIFKSNVKNLRLCKDFNVNLNKCNGIVDLGTLWELGFIFGQHPEWDWNTSDYGILGADQDLEDQISRIRECLLATKVDTTTKIAEGSTKTRLFYKNIAKKRVDSTLQMIYPHMAGTMLSAVIDGLALNSSDRHIIVVDDRPMQCYILMGWMYAKGIPYYTASFANHGSNFMISASSGGHMKMTGLYDEVKNLVSTDEDRGSK
jgi:nucleoside 2-deoxyribosyltransferase